MASTTKHQTTVGHPVLHVNTHSEGAHTLRTGVLFCHHAGGGTTTFQEHARDL
jgi:hypothetical protein